MSIRATHVHLNEERNVILIRESPKTGQGQDYIFSWSPSLTLSKSLSQQILLNLLKRLPFFLIEIILKNRKYHEGLLK